MNLYRNGGKRFVELLLTIPVLVLTAPLLAALALLVRIKLGSPVLFQQQRPGRGGQPFDIIKFRTMTDARGPDGQLLSDAERITHFGRFLRTTSLDELPELINIVRGEMSLVGPRPLLMEYLGNYTPEQARRHDVRPGLTGWAQINGRNNALFSERVKLDLWYVDNLSLMLDFRILFRTVIKVIRRSDIRLELSDDEMDDLGLHPDTRARNARAAALKAQETNESKGNGLADAR
ncbi:MAG: sugar transferase [Verrucomicrobiota bacterium]|nr:sugar transferase [Verrucomicrobiota bacterium]